jgi:hypothetical protein
MHIIDYYYYYNERSCSKGGKKEELASEIGPTTKKQDN